MAATTTDLNLLLAQRQRGYTLPQAFYIDSAVYTAELERIWRRQWLMAGHSCELPAAGSFVVVDIAGDSILLTRDEQGAVRAMHNVCRHRGSLICDGAGSARRLVCPYHQWSYGLDGRLLAAPGVAAADGELLALKSVNVAEAGGFIFVQLDADRAATFAHAAELDAHLNAYQLRETKIAAAVEYEVKANWKVIFENNRECLHCRSNHPEYCRATFDVARDAAMQADHMAAQIERLRPTLQRNGLDACRLSVSSGMTAGGFRLNHTPLVDGFVTESLDGRPVAPPLGSLDTIDVGTARITAFPNFWCHVSGDHAVTTRLLPLAVDKTRITVSWLVRGDAVEGRDFQLDRLLPFWKCTSEQDWPLCERVQAGIASRGYQPGPLAPKLEANVEQFLEWVMERLRRNDEGECGTGRPLL